MCVCVRVCVRVCIPFHSIACGVIRSTSSSGSVCVPCLSAIGSAHVADGTTRAKKRPDVDDDHFFVWSSWKGALPANSSPDAALEHTPWARVFIRGRSVARPDGICGTVFSDSWGFILLYN